MLWNIGIYHSLPAPPPYTLSSFSPWFLPLSYPLVISSPGGISPRSTVLRNHVLRLPCCAWFIPSDIINSLGSSVDTDIGVWLFFWLNNIGSYTFASLVMIHSPIHRHQSWFHILAMSGSAAVMNTQIVGILLDHMVAIFLSPYCFA